MKATPSRATTTTKAAAGTATTRTREEKREEKRREEERREQPFGVRTSCAVCLFWPNQKLMSARRLEVINHLDKGARTGRRTRRKAKRRMRENQERETG